MGASGAYATITSWPCSNWREESGWTISVKVRPLSLPESTRIVAFLQVPEACCCADEPSAVEVSPVGVPPEAFTDLQSTLSTLVTVACWVCRSKPTPVRSCPGAPPGQSTARPTTTAAAKGISTAAMILRRCMETGAAGPCEWPCPPP